MRLFAAGLTLGLTIASAAHVYGFWLGQEWLRRGGAVR